MSSTNDEGGAKNFLASPIWESKKERMKNAVEHGWWKSWIGKGVPIDDDGTTLTLVVPNFFIRDRLRNQELVVVGRLEKILQRRIEFTVDPKLKESS